MNRVNELLALGLVLAIAITVAAVEYMANAPAVSQALVWSACGLAALGMSFNLTDASLKVTRALPGGASTSVSSTPIDLQNSARGDFVANCEVLVSAPAVTTTMAPDTRTLTYSLETDADVNFGSPVVLHPSLIVQTGAGGAGAAAATQRFRLPVGVERYIRLKITSGASITDSSAVSATLELRF